MFGSAKKDKEKKHRDHSTEGHKKKAKLKLIKSSKQQSVETGSENKGRRDGLYPCALRNFLPSLSSN